MAKEKKGLGIGLDALFGAAEIGDGETELQYLPIAKVEPRLEQPRALFDEQALELWVAGEGMVTAEFCGQTQRFETGEPAVLPVPELLLLLLLLSLSQKTM